MAYGDDPPTRGPSGLIESSRGVWAFTTDVDLLRRLAGAGFDWVALDAQHGPVDRAALHEVGRGLADAGADLVVRVRRSTRCGSAPHSMPVPRRSSYRP